MPHATPTPTEYIGTPHMTHALALAAQAAAQGEIPVGAVIVNPATNTVVAATHNLTEATHDPTAHAEILAIRAACTVLGSPRLPGLDIYVTLEPCPMCAAALSFARIRRIYFGAYDPKSGGISHGARVFDAPSCHHIPEVYGGLQEKAAKALLKTFFQSLRT
jgi:tRNA(Arg) A34 adenosine deaminase TadA